MPVKGSFHQHYHTISQLADALQHAWTGAVLQEAYSLSKQELILVFNKNGSVFTMKVITKSGACFLLFDETPFVKGSNAQPCFEDGWGSMVNGIRMHSYNRSFSCVLQNGMELVFKMYDALANVLLVQHNEVKDLFRESIQSDLVYDAAAFNVTDENIIRSIDAMPYTPNCFYIYKRPDEQHPYYFALSQTSDELVGTYTHVIEALNQFSRLCLSYYGFFEQKHKVLQGLKDQLKNLSVVAKRTRQSLHDLLNEISPEEIGHILMANLHTVQTGETSVTLHDFYRDRSIIIKLKKELNAQQNAAYYYRKAKNRKIELTQLEEKLEHTALKIEAAEQKLQQAQQAESVKGLKTFIKQQPLKPKQATEQFRQFVYEGYTILVGKSAANNDELTLKHAHKNDLWLHAKDVSGSHVVIRQIAGKDFPKQVIEYAAGIAAYYSKLKGSRLVPVSYTLKKFVRKPKGMEPGQVVVDREEVLMAEPKLQA